MDNFIKNRGRLYNPLVSLRYPIPRDEKPFLLVISVFRACTFAFAVGLVLAANNFDIRPGSDALILVLVGTYTVIRVMFRIPRYQKTLSIIGFILDLVIAMSLLIITRGLFSPYLLYSLTPILISSMLFRPKNTLWHVFLPTLAAAAGYIITISSADFVFKENYVILVILLLAYATASIIIAWVAYSLNRSSEVARLQAFDTERKRLSRDIHDSLAQDVTILSWQLGMLRRKAVELNPPLLLTEIDDILRVVNHLKSQTRQVIDKLRSEQNSPDLIFGLSQITADFNQNQDIRCILNLSGQQVDLPQPKIRELLYVVQEALMNVRKHSSASQVLIDLKFQYGHLEVSVRDNGCGFDTDQFHAGHGLQVMKERTVSIGGEMFIISKSGWGTEIKIVIKVDLLHEPRSDDADNVALMGNLQ